MNERVFGIDLGTTNTAISYLYMVDRRPEISLVENDVGAQLTPSVVYFPPGITENYVVGDTAKEQYMHNPDRTFRWVKRYMGQEIEWPVTSNSGSLSVTPVTISGRILAEMADYAQKALELPQPVKRVVITVPAYFGDLQRKATLDAADIAGLEATLLEEPVAAVLDYVVRLQQDGRLAETFPGGKGYVGVFDLGGGTFDMSVCEVAIKGKVPSIAVVAKDGDPLLGGYDFDLELAQLVLAKALHEHPANPHLQDLQDAFREFRSDGRVSDPELRDVVADVVHTAEIVKERLSKLPETSFRIPRFRGTSVSVNVSRTEFEGVLEPYLIKVEQVVARTLDQAKANSRGQLTAWNQVNRVVMIGGSTRVPKIEALAKRLFPTMSNGGDVDKAVAKGAAIMAAMQSGLLVLGGLALTTSHDYGLLDARGNLSQVIVPQGSPYPSEYTLRYAVPFSLETAVPLHIGQRYAGTSASIAEKKFHHPFLYTGDVLEVTLSVDENGMLHCRAVEPNTPHVTLEETVLEEIGMSSAEKRVETRRLRRKGAAS